MVQRISFDIGSEKYFIERRDKNGKPYFRFYRYLDGKYYASIDTFVFLDILFNSVHTTIGAC